MINFNQYGAKPGVARQAGLLQQQMESNPVQPYVPFSQQSGLTPQVAPQVAPQARLSPHLGQRVFQILTGIGMDGTVLEHKPQGGK